MEKSTIEIVERSTLPAGISQEQMDSWKAKWGKYIYVIDVPTDRDGSKLETIVIKSPENDIRICGLLENEIVRNDFRKARQIAVENCIIQGKDKVMDNPFSYNAASSFILGRMPMAEAVVKN